MPELIKKIFIFLIISGLCVSAFFVRFENFKKPTPRTTDEIVYYMMARQMEENFFDYNATNFSLYEMIAHQKKYPPYFYDPLFKHPPLLMIMIMGSVKMFGPTALGAGFFPLFLGALSIALIYLMGRLVSGRVVGLMAAGLMWMDPVAIMSSQKVWMDAPLMFFMLLTVYGYWRGFKKKQDFFFLLGGVSAGAALMIKYPGILTFLIMILFFLMTHPRVFRNRIFQRSLIIPVVMSIPWVFWNYHVYGLNFLIRRIAIHGSFSFSLPFILLLASLCLWFACLLLKVVRNRMFVVPETVSNLFSSKLVFFIKWAGFIGMAVFALIHTTWAFNFFEIPYVSWRQGAFSGEPGWFYLRRLLEYNFLYAFGYLAFFDPFLKRSDDRFLLKINAFLILFFFIAWGNFQCRYILPALPFFMVLASDYIWRLLVRLGKMDIVLIRLVLQAAILVLIVLAVSKTMVVNQQISFTNDMCYF